MPIKLWDAVGVIGLDQKALKKGLGEAKKGFALGIKGLVKIAKKGAKVLAVAVTGIAAGLATIAVVSLKKFAEFEKGIAEIQTLFGQADAKSEELREDLEESVGVLVRGWGQKVPDAIKATYDAVSAGIKRADVAAFTEQAAKLAIAGASDIATSVDLLTTIINSYGLEAEDAERISDELFTTVRLGKTTIDELAAGMGQVASIAATAGVSTKDLFASLATLTAAGLKTDIAITGMRGAISGILGPTDESIVLAKKLGIEWNAAGLKAQGLSGLLGQLAEKTGGNVEQIRILIPDIRAFSAIVTATSETGLAKFIAAQKEMAAVNGATAAGVKIMTDTVTFQWSRMSGGINLALIRIGKSLNKAFGPMLKDLNAWIDENKEGFEEVSTALDNMVEKIRQSATDGRLSEMIKSLKGIGKAIFELAKEFNDPNGEFDKAVSGFIERLQDKSGDLIRVGGDLAGFLIKGFGIALAVGAGGLINEFLVEPFERWIENFERLRRAAGDPGDPIRENLPFRPRQSIQRIENAQFTFNMPDSSPETVEEGVGRALLKIQRQAGSLSRGFVEAGA